MCATVYRVRVTLRPSQRLRLEYLDPNNKTPCRVLLFYYEALCNCIIDAVLCQEGRYPKPRAVREFLHELHHYHGVL